MSITFFERAKLRRAKLDSLTFPTTPPFCLTVFTTCVRFHWILKIPRTEEKPTEQQAQQMTRLTLFLHSDCLHNSIFSSDGTSSKEHQKSSERTLKELAGLKRLWAWQTQLRRSRLRPMQPRFVDTVARQMKSIHSELIVCQNILDERPALRRLYC